MASPEGGNSLLELDGVGFSYGKRQVLHEITLELHGGETVGLLGPNGSGKSTLIKLLSAVTREYEGSIRIDGQELRDLPRRELARQVAVVPQEPSFSFSFNVLEIVLMGRHPHLAGLAFESEADIELAREALDRCNALELAHRRIDTLSAGERQRVVFARALTQSPDLLLLDEPASFLDVRHQVEIYDIVRSRVEQRSTGVLSVMHDLNLAAEYCDRIYLLRDGRIEAAGPTAEVLTYANLTHVFDTDVYVDTHRLTGKLVILPLSGREQRKLGQAKLEETPCDPPSES